MKSFYQLNYNATTPESRKLHNNYGHKKLNKNVNEQRTRQTDLPTFISIDQSLFCTFSCVILKELDLSTSWAPNLPLSVSCSINLSIVYSSLKSNSIRDIRYQLTYLPTLSRPSKPQFLKPGD